MEVEESFGLLFENGGFEPTAAILPVIRRCISISPGENEVLRAIEIALCFCLKNFSINELECELFQIACPAAKNMVIGKLTNLESNLTGCVESFSTSLKIMAYFQAVFEYLNELHQIAITEVKSLLIATCEILLSCFSHCNVSEKVYGILFDSLTEHLSIFFKKCCDLLDHLLNFLTEKMKCEMDEAEALLLVEIMSFLSKSAFVLINLDIKIMAKLWKAYAVLIEKYLCCLKNNYNIGEIIKELCCKITFNIEEIFFKDNPDFNKVVKLSCFLLKLVIKFSKAFLGHFKNCQNFLLSLLLMLCKCNIAIEVEAERKKNINLDLLTQLTAGADPLLSHLMTDEKLIQECQEVSKDPKKSVEFSILCCLILKKLLNENSATRSLWFNENKNILEWIFHSSFYRECKFNTFLYYIMLSAINQKLTTICISSCLIIDLRENYRKIYSQYLERHSWNFWWSEDLYEVRAAFKLIIILSLTSCFLNLKAFVSFMDYPTLSRKTLAEHVFKKIAKNARNGNKQLSFESRFITCTNIHLPTILINGTPRKFTDLYEYVFVNTSAFLMTSTADEYRLVEKTLIENVLQVNPIRALFAIDIWCILGRFADSELLFTQILTLGKVFLEFHPQTSRVEKWYLASLICRLYPLLTERHRILFLNSLPTSFSSALRECYFDGLPSDRPSDVIQVFVEEIESSETELIFPTKRQNINDKGNFGHEIIKLWKFNCGVLSCISQYSIFLKNICTLTAQVVSGVPSKSLLTVLSQMKKLLVIGQPTCVKLYLIYILKSLSTVKIPSDEFQKKILTTVAELFRDLLLSKNAFVKQKAFENFYTFSHVTSHGEVISLTVQNLPELRQEVINFLKKKPPTQIDFSLNYFIDELYQLHFEHTCQVTEPVGALIPKKFKTVYTETEEIMVRWKEDSIKIIEYFNLLSESQKRDFRNICDSLLTVIR